jgi:hypothetical protein
MTLGSKSYYKPTGSILVNSAQIVHMYFKYLGFCSFKMTPDETRLESRHQANHYERIIVVNASGSKRGVA